MNVPEIPIGLIIGPKQYEELHDKSDFVETNGQAISIQDHLDLFHVIGFIYGRGDEPGTFCVPDFRCKIYGDFGVQTSFLPENYNYWIKAKRRQMKLALSG